MEKSQNANKVKKLLTTQEIGEIKEQISSLAARIKNVFLIMLEKTGPLLILIFIGLVVGILNPRFFSPTNILNILRQSSPLILTSAGMTFVILTAGIDLSVGGIMGLTGAVLLGTIGMGTPLAVFAALATGVTVGAFNGLLIARWRMVPFVATLATMAITRSITYVYTGGRPLIGVTPFVAFVGRGHIGGYFPVCVVVALLGFVVSHVVLRHTRFGIYVYAIGANRKAANLTGISVRRCEIIVYMISGFLAAWAGIVLAGRLNSAYPNTGVGYELNAIAAVILGGTSFFGGVGGVGGTIIGALIIGVIQNSLNLLHINVFWQQGVVGMVILVAVVLDAIRRRGTLSE